MSRQDSKQIENVKVMLLKGENGSSIESIEKTGTQGAVDTYTITLTDGSKFTFTVTNGATITDIQKTATQGLVDTYTITMSDGTTSTFTVKNGADGEDGVGIVSIKKTSTQGAVDTYTITLTDGSTATFTVTNATGVVDASLDANSTNAIQNKAVTEKFNAVDDDIAPTENGTTASRTYNADEYIIRDNQLYVATTTIASGGTFTEGVNIEETTIGEELTAIKSDLTDLTTKTIVNGTSLGDVTTTAQSHTTVGSITLSKGSYIVNVTVDCKGTAPNQCAVRIGSWDIVSAYINVSHDHLINATLIMTTNLDSDNIPIRVWCSASCTANLMIVQAFKLN